MGLNSGFGAFAVCPGDVKYFLHDASRKDDEDALIIHGGSAGWGPGSLYPLPSPLVFGGSWGVGPGCRVSGPYFRPGQMGVAFQGWKFYCEWGREWG